jgi:hypothetical protein
MSYGLENEMNDEILKNRAEIDVLCKQLEDLKQRDAAIVEVITAMYDQVHEERDNLRKKLEVARVGLLKAEKSIWDGSPNGYWKTIITDTLDALPKSHA